MSIEQVHFSSYMTHQWYLKWVISPYWDIFPPPYCCLNPLLFISLFIAFPLPEPNMLESPRHFFLSHTPGSIIYPTDYVSTNHTSVFKLSVWLSVWTSRSFTSRLFSISIEISNSHHKLDICQNDFGVLSVQATLGVSFDSSCIFLYTTSKSNSKFCVFYHQ